MVKKDFFALFRRRSLCVLLIFAIAAASLSAVLFRMQVTEYEEYQRRVLDQITVGSALKANRGRILDRNGNVLAENMTVWRIYISPVDIQSVKRRTGRAVDEEIARGLSEIVGVPYDEIYRRAQRSYRLDETILKKADKEITDRVLKYTEENGFSAMIHTEASVARYYRYRSLAAQTLGFTGGDNQGLFGLELY